MADDLNNEKMDELLRSYASKRREAPEVQLHPATRRMLQEEARRVRGKAGTRRSPWLAWWPQIAFGCALVMVLGITAAVLRRGPAERQMARTTAAEEAEIGVLKASEPSAPAGENRAVDAALPPVQAQEGRLALSVPAEPAVESSELEQLTQAAAERRELVVADAALPPATEQKEQASASDPLAFYRKNPELMRRYFPHLASATETQGPVSTSLAGQPGPAPALRMESAARFNEITNLGAATRTRFAQANGAGAPVLRAFQFEQLGPQIRLVDADGSIYLGELRENAAGGTAAAAEPAAPSFAVLATGRSLTLGRAVTFQGSFFPRTNIAPVSVVTRQVNRLEVASKRLAPEAGPARAAIVGRAAIEGTNDVSVNAFSLER